MTPNQTKFHSELITAYRDLFKTPEYAYAVARNTPEGLADKMIVSLIGKTANKEGDGVKRACKACGIKQTYKEIYAYLEV